MWRAAVLLCFILQGATVAADNETWGYVEIRHKAHLFWWYYKSPHRVSSPVKPWPTILWLEGGPGGSGVGGGNFQGIGPLDVNLKPHNSTWLQKADFQLSYAQLLHDVSRLSDEAVAPLNRMAAIVKEQIAAGQFTTAKMTWTNLVDLIDQQSDGVDMLNFLLDKGEGSSTSQVFPSTPNTIDGLMNGVIKEKLKVIPKNIIWQGVAIQVFEAMNATYMKPAIDEVDQLLAYGVNVSVYNGQFDVICSTIGVEAWVKKLKWAGLKSFLSTPRQALRYCDSPARCLNPVKAYARSYQNLNFYWILGAGHKVPVDKPDVALRMISSIVQSPDS
ncbi:unnamed protein product [Triticum turgidum subsp. durum]|uniref:Carboxypeptidase n=1 Tax=Triticum turgidum subsp. durum TaxID=4567 RepID=A0A9R0VVP6_TRITD|nr:unnamed protein product [Triticum turgidum subsp. durum]